jgi:hypothetical protein
MPSRRPLPRNPRSNIRGVFVYCGDDWNTESGPFRDEDDARWHRELFDKVHPDCSNHEVEWNDEPMPT